MTSIQFYASPPGETRSRRATDVVTLGLAFAALAVLVVAYHPSELLSAVDALVASLPGWLGPIWLFLYRLLGLWALALLVVPVCTRRSLLSMHALAALLLALALGLLATRIALGEWPELEAALHGASRPSDIPAFGIAEAAAVTATMTPHLVRPLRVTSRWIVALAVLGAVCYERTSFVGSIAAVLVAVVAAASIRLAAGTSAGRPGLESIAGSLAELGVTVRDLRPAERQTAGVYTVQGVDATGRELLIKVYGRDAYDNQLLAKFWRMLWYRNGGAALSVSRVQGVEHEAFLTMRVRGAGVPTREVITAGTTSEGDALLVLSGTATTAAAHPERFLDDATLRRAWQALARLQAANVAHLQIDPSALALVDGEVGLVDFGGATVAPDAARLLADRAQLLVTTAALAGPERSLRAAVDALGDEGLTGVLPYLQPAAFSASLRRGLKSAGVDTDALRKQAARIVGAEPPELVELRRVSGAALVQAGLLAFAAAAVASAVMNVDMAQLRTTLDEASWGWVGVGFLVAQLPRVAFAVATLGSVAARLRFGPVYLMQLAIGYMNLALPSSLARAAVNIRFFQRQGVPPAAAVTSGAIDSVAGNVVQILLLTLLLILTEATLAFDLNAPSGGGAGLLLAILVLVVVASVLAVALVPRLRRRLTEPVRRSWPDVRRSLVTLRRFDKIGLVLFGNLAAELCFATALGLLAHAFGYDIPLSELLVINISISLLASFVPVPGGIGVVEWGLTVGLVAAGMTSSAALATVFLYRAATFYIPPLWGWLALRWLRRNRYL